MGLRNSTKSIVNNTTIQLDLRRLLKKIMKYLYKKSSRDDYDDYIKTKKNLDYTSFFTIYLKIKR